MHVGGAGKIRRSFSRDTSVKDLRITPSTKRRIFIFLKPYKWILAFFFVIIIIDALIGVANPLIYREIINSGILKHNSQLIIKFALVIGGLAFFDAVLSLGQYYISSKIGENLTFEMRKKIFSHIQKMPLAFFTRVQTGALVSRLNNDVLGAQEAFNDVLSSVVGNIISVLFVLAAIIALSWQLTIVALLLLPMFILPAKWFGVRLQRITTEKYNLSAEMSSTMIEKFNVSGALLSKLFGQPKRENDLFARKAKRVRDISVTQTLYTRFFRIALSLTAALAIAIVYGWGGVMSVKGALDVGTVVALTAYLNRLYGPLISLSNINVDVMTALVSFERVFEILDIKPLITEKAGATDLKRGKAKLEFTNVNFAYPAARDVSLASLESVATLDHIREKSVLFDISFFAKPGQMVALVGRSGGGKTTITQLAGRLYDVGSGAIFINGVDIRDATLGSIRDMIGVVTQDAHMFHETIRENLLFAKPKAKDTEIWKALKSAQISELVKSLPQGLDTMVGERGYRLSGGEKQRLAIARLILKAPDLVILDEATAHLDSESEKLIQNALETVLRGRTSLVIAHRLSTILKADQILVVEKGRIVERGRHEELLKRGGLYAELYKTQFLGTGKIVKNR